MYEYTTGNNTVDAVGQIQFTGNIIPQVWYKTIVKDNKKPYLLAICLLADIVYWYRPTELRDEKTGKFIGYAKKFKDKHMLQRSYDQFSDLYGESKRSITDAIVYLEKIGVIKRIFRTIEVGGMRCNNVLFIDLFPDVLEKLTYPEKEGSTPPIPKYRGRGHKNEAPLSQNIGGGVTLKRDTNTKITTKITTEITQSDQSIINQVRRQIDYEDLLQEYQHHKKLIDGAILTIVDVLKSNSANLRVNGSDTPTGDIQARFKKLTGMDVIYAIESIVNSSVKATNIRALLITSLYNAIATRDLYFANWVSSDMAKEYHDRQ